MTIKRITVSFVGPDGVAKFSATGSVDRRAELIRDARARLEAFRSQARRGGDPAADVDYDLEIADAKALAAWSPKG